MDEQNLARKFEELRANYKRYWLVRDTKAFEEFCFANSDAISQLLAKGAGINWFG